jgi:hypothetical protein
MTHPELMKFYNAARERCRLERGAPPLAAPPFRLNRLSKIAGGDGLRSFRLVARRPEKWNHRR